jgi:hypothetical protein
MIPYCARTVTLAVPDFGLDVSSGNDHPSSNDHHSSNDQHSSETHPSPEDHHSSSDPHHEHHAAKKRKVTSENGKVVTGLPQRPSLTLAKRDVEMRGHTAFLTFAYKFQRET